MLTAQSRQKRYADKHHRKLEFDVGDLVYLKVSPMRGVMRFGKKGKLGPRFIGLFEVTEIVRPVAYKIRLPPALSGVHDVFHISNLRKHVHDLLHIVDFKPLQIQEDLQCEEMPVQILDHKDTRNKSLERRPFLWLRSFGEITT
jgi:hypothetical protein